ncbi:hypothetical protein CDL15_Pgr027319 [Punica granatum]|uniref:Uncharacterized protein n=1 Tax=Punica granatum TaxID=22663 RepID=A0A218WCV5_PUNGR|nr:hypothetical protein CDL15_Pgr027319 [Punica granatum]
MLYPPWQPLSSMPYGSLNTINCVTTASTYTIANSHAPITSVLPSVPHATTQPMASNVSYMQQQGVETYSQQSPYRKASRMTDPYQYSA